MALLPRILMRTSVQAVGEDAHMRVPTARDVDHRLAVRDAAMGDDEQQGE